MRKASHDRRPGSPDRSVAVAHIDSAGRQRHTRRMAPSPFSIDLAGRVALVTGANRGIGFEVALGLAGAGATVVSTARQVEAGKEAVDAIARRTSGDVRFEPLDVADAASVDAAAERIGPVDILVNNAGVYPTTPILSVDEPTVVEALGINFLGPWRLCQAFVPGMNERRWGRVVNVSSGLGQFCDSAPGSGIYGITKVALNALTKQVAASARSGVLVNSGSPGWTATDMGGRGAANTPAEGADTILWLAGLPDDGPNGGFFENRRPLAW